MRVAIAAALAAVLLWGCAGRMIQSGMDSMVGQPLSAVIAKLGVPNEEQTIAGQKVYTWYSGRLIEGTTSSCRIRAIMRGDIIATWDYEGNESACWRYASRLR